MSAPGLQVRTVVEDALGAAGAWPVSQPSPHEHHVVRALRSAEQVITDLASTHEIPWLKRTYTFDLTAGTIDYPLLEITQTGAGCSASYIEHWQHVHLLYVQSGRRRRLKLLYEPEWSDRRRQTIPGRPHVVWIERILPPILRIYPQPSEDNVFRLELVGQVMPAKVCDDDAVEVPFPSGWRKWLKLAVAYEISDGSIVRLPIGRREEIKRDRDQALQNLLDYSADEHRRPRIMAAWGIDPSRYQTRRHGWPHGGGHHYGHDRRGDGSDGDYGMGGNYDELPDWSN